MKESGKRREYRGNVKKSHPYDENQSQLVYPRSLRIRLRSAVERISSDTHLVSFYVLNYDFSIHKINKSGPDILLFA